MNWFSQLLFTGNLVNLYWKFQCVFKNLLGQFTGRLVNIFIIWIPDNLRTFTGNPDGNGNTSGIPVNNYWIFQKIFKIVETFSKKKA